MQKKLIITAGIALLACTSAHAIDEQYRQQLERSGCTQVSELQGCDIHKSRAENAQAGFASQAPAETTSASSQTPWLPDPAREERWLPSGSMTANGAGSTVRACRPSAAMGPWFSGREYPLHHPG
ncbi:hypothetical protein [Pseudomonas sp. L-22-4S-12]|uniref:hypothetical protein n=1 Tax=Pseudomonas sp. L-22-4S-12 TaxID=2610893 RepID=UPI002115A286|nr:hypothetical protein [Pseudomonas sp. L-22-4S-12]